MTEEERMARHAAMDFALRRGPMPTANAAVADAEKIRAFLMGETAAKPNEPNESTR